jgi:hypothetical protein
VCARRRKAVSHEGAKLYFLVVLAGMQRVEIGNAVDTEDHGFAVDYEMPTAVLERGLDDPGVTAAPVVAVACNTNPQIERPM